MTTQLSTFLLSLSQIFQIQKFTDNNLHATFSRLNNEDPSKFNFVDTVRWLFLMGDAGYTSEFGIADGEIAVLDFKGFSWWHLMKVAGNINVLRAFLKYIQVKHVEVLARVAKPEK